VSDGSGLAYFKPAGVTGAELKSTSEYAGAVNVELSVKFRTEAEIPKGATLEFQIPSNYPHMTTSTPLPTCKVEGLTNATCTITQNKMVVTGFDTIPPTHEIKITGTGIRNPTSASVIPAAPNGFRLQAYTTSSTNTILSVDLTKPFDTTS
jgi:hypothetical protein